MDPGFHKNPWFLTLAGITLWACGYVAADDNRIERENRAGYGMEKDARHSSPFCHDKWHKEAKNRRDRLIR